MDENTPGERPSLSIEQAAEKLRQSREPKAEETPEVAEDQAEVTEEAEDEPEAEAEEIPEEDHPEEEAEEEAETADDDGALYEVAGETFTLAELREWKKNGLRQSDYTKKTQQLAEERKALEAERDGFKSEAQQVAEYLKAQEAQLKAALETFAITQTPKPKRSDFPNTDAYLLAVDRWETAEAKKQEARRTYQALQEQQHQETVKRETAQLMRHIPEWRDPKAFEAAAAGMMTLGKDYGFSPEEMSAITDHRMFRVLNDLMQLRGKASQSQVVAKAAEKKAVSAVKRLQPGAKKAETQATKELRQTRERLKKTGSMQDAVALLQARRSQA
jgi:hypothetical protein